MTLTQINRAGLDADALDRVFTIGASGSSAYTFQGEGLNGTVNNPTLYLTRGKTYRFENGSGGHPIRIQSTSGASGTAYNTGVTNNAGSGTVIVEVQHDAPDVLYYQCTSHAAMNGILYITGALADGGVTTAKIADDAVTAAKINTNAVFTGSIQDGAVTTAKLSNDAVTTVKITDSNITNAKLANSSVSTAKLQDGSVTTAKISDQAVTLAKLPHGTSSNDGKFLRANNGADPTFETVTGTTINNNADNRVITGSGTANTLNGESLVTIDSSGRLSVAPNAGGSGITLASQGSTYGGTVKLRNTTSSNHDWLIGVGGGDGAYVAGRGLMIRDDTTGANRIAISTAGNVGIGTVNPQANLHVQVSGTDAPIAQFSSASYTGYVGTAHADNNIGNGSKAGNLVIRGQTGVAIMGNNGTTTQVKIDADGLKFGTDTAAANALDDYEEGTWTPFFMFYNIYTSSWQNCTMDAAGTIQQPKYTKIGRWVTASFNWSDFQINSSTKDYARIGGLPFTATAYGAALAGYNNVFQYNQNNGGWLANGQTSVEFYRDNNSWNHWVGGQTRHLQVTVHYQAS